MSFAAPGYLWFAALAPLAAALFAGWLTWRRRAQRSFGAAAHGSPLDLAAPALVVVAILLASAAAARPQIGNHHALAEDRGIDLVIVLDVSQSMYATDAQPSRIERAQSEIIALLDRLQGDRVGLVVFAGRPFVRSPLTSDLPALSRLVEGVHQERALVPAGSDLGAAIREASSVIERGDARTQALLVISDGEDHGSTIAPAVDEARLRHVRVYAAGVGTEQGAPVLDIDPATGLGTPRVGRDGNPVVTHLDALALRLLAESGDGRYIELTGNGRPLTALAPELDSLDQTTFGAQERAQPIDRYAIFAWAALAVLLTATALPAAVPRRRAGAAASWRRLLPLAGAGLMIGAVCASNAVSANRAGNQRYASGDFTGALDAYRTAEAIDPSERAVLYNASNTLHQLDRLNEAIDEAKRALPADDALSAKVEYALGNHYAAAGRLLEAVEAYKRSLLDDPGDIDAKHNLEVISKRLRETPSPTPTPTAPSVEVTPTPGSDDGDPNGGQSGEGASTPQAGDGNGTPQAVGSPGPVPDGEMTPEQVQRALDEALRGIDQDFSVDEALRVLDLLERQNRDQLRQPGAGEGGAPDY